MVFGWHVMNNENVATFVQGEVELKANVAKSALAEAADALLNSMSQSWVQGQCDCNNRCFVTMHGKVVGLWRERH